ncbi:MAG: hypothetical protein BJBARM5_0284 [Candidatus Parvarchaeum acidophilus ARMAN-5]|jgi:putative hydrolase of the HAD superfamily|uniref:HAD-superfamily hydrolase, subfamily IA, variant 1 n=1 Tax=Candidatus Parvarchaeum acidophilus ARMAN-5 TaxID=662762 RepID=D6GUY4_PARA5|nr:MAG: hypothetical protein BJBARM5_0284 [Candidatus Parvarchaeum acidophilus ARMAN-5]
MKKEIKGVIFDLDNTLIDIHNTVKNADDAVFEEIKKDFKQINYQLFREFIDKTNKEFKTIPYDKRNIQLFYEIFARVSSVELEQKHIEKYSNIFEEYFLRRLEFTDEADETIKKLKKAGLKIGLLTGEGLYPGSKTKTISNIEFIHHFDITVIAKVNIAESKEEVEAFVKTASMLELKPSEIIFVGDMPEIDIDNAKKAGMMAVLFDKYNVKKGRKKIFEPDYIIETMKDLYRILDIDI